VKFYSKNKFEKLVHMVGFIIRIYHVARSDGRQNPWTKFNYRFTVRIIRLCNPVSRVCYKVLNRSSNEVSGLWLGSGGLGDIFGYFLREHRGVYDGCYLTCIVGLDITRNAIHINSIYCHRVSFLYANFEVYFKHCWLYVGVR